MAASLPPESSIDYTDALRRLLSLADFERMAGAASPIPKSDLGRMRELADRVGRPQAGVPVVHVAGTKGKGSVAAVTSSILSAAGLRVALFTSPHLHSFRERLRLNGSPVSEEQFSRTLVSVWPHVRAMAEESDEGEPTTFEALTAMAFELTQAERADVLVLEVGLGGRLDSTNVVEAAVDVITSISLDHTAILGNTLAEVAWEKAGIIKGSTPVVVAPQRDEAMGVIETRAAEHGARLTLVGRDIRVHAEAHDLTAQRFTVETGKASYDLYSPLLGAHQRENVAVAIGAVEALGAEVAQEAVVEGVRGGRWDGRFQVLVPEPGALAEGPHVIVDGAHNPYSIARLRETALEYVAPAHTVVVFGCSGDKDLEAMVEELRELATTAVVCASRHPRAVEPQRVAEAFVQAGVPARRTADIPAAIQEARALCGPGDLVLVTGSLFVAAEALEFWYGIPVERYPELDPREQEPRVQASRVQTTRSSRR